MFVELASNAHRNVAIVESFITQHDEFIRQQELEKRSSYKVYSVASCVMRLYAIYERFVEEIISDYIDAIPELTKYSELSDGFKKEYQHGMSFVLGKLDTERYSHLNHEKVIAWYYEALTNSARYRIVTEAFTRHDQNLRFNTVENLTLRLGLPDLGNWLARNVEIEALYDTDSAILEQLTAELKLFVQVRNDAAHGAMEDLQGIDNLQRYCALVKALISALTSFFYKNLLARRVQEKKSLRIGTVTEVFTQAGAYIAQINSGCSLQCGMSLHVVGASYCLMLPINELQIDDVSVDAVTAIENTFEVGIKSDRNPKRRAELFMDIDIEHDSTGIENDNDEGPAQSNAGSKTPQ